MNYVLGRFFEEEKPLLEETIKRAVVAAQCVIENGVLAAMNIFNKVPEL